MRLVQLLGCCLVLALFSADSIVTIFDGEYMWNEDGRTGAITATFTAAEDGTWDVSFDFDYAGGEHTYKGIAWGSLTEGKLRGEVAADDGPNRYVFEGSVADGVYEGTHSIVVGAESKESGTLKLERRSD